MRHEFLRLAGWASNVNKIVETLQHFWKDNIKSKWRGQQDCMYHIVFVVIAAPICLGDTSSSTLLHIRLQHAIYATAHQHIEVLALSSGRDINDFSNLWNKEIQQSTNNDDYHCVLSKISDGRYLAGMWPQGQVLAVSGPMVWTGFQTVDFPDFSHLEDIVWPSSSSQLLPWVQNDTIRIPYIYNKPHIYGVQINHLYLIMILNLANMHWYSI